MKTMRAAGLMLALAATSAAAATPIGTHGTLVVVPAFGEATRANDEAQLLFTADEQDPDKAAAAARVNEKMRRGLALVKRADPGARLKTRDYRTFPVYADNAARPGMKSAPIVAWRVVESLEVTTNDLASLKHTAGAVQPVLALDGVQFGLSKASARAADDAAIGSAYEDLLERLGAIARAMGREPSDATLETLDYEGSGRYEPKAELRAAVSSAASTAPVEPSFEPGETTVRLRIVGKARFR